MAQDWIFLYQTRSGRKFNGFIEIILSSFEDRFEQIVSFSGWSKMVTSSRTYLTPSCTSMDARGYILVHIPQDLNAVETPSLSHQSLFISVWNKFPRCVCIKTIFPGSGLSIRTVTNLVRHTVFELNDGKYHTVISWLLNSWKKANGGSDEDDDNDERRRIAVVSSERTSYSARTY